MQRSMAVAGALALAEALGAHAVSAGTGPQAAVDTGMVVELRQYTLHPGQRDVLVRLFEREFVETQEAAGMHLLGQFRDLHDRDRFVWLRGFDDMPRRAEALAAFYGGPAWQAHRDAANATMVDSDNVLLLRPARAGSGFVRDDAPPPAAGAVIPLGVVEARLLYAPSTVSDGQVEAVLAAAEAPLRRVGGSLLAAMVDEPAANNFPRLPVREGEHVLALFAQFPTRSAYDAYRAALLASAPWRGAVEALVTGAPRPPDVLLLSPTPRSRLPR